MAKPARGDAEAKHVKPPPPARSAGGRETEGQAETANAGDKGVIRLLEAGHFKGVADVRLRINFHEELSARAGAAATDAATAGTEALIDSVTAKAQELVGTWGLDEESQAGADELVAGFEAAARAALGDSTQQGKVGVDRLADSLRSAFAALEAQLAALVPVADPTEPPAGDGTVPPAGDETQPPAPEPAEGAETAEGAAGTADGSLMDATQEPLAEEAGVPAANPELASLSQLFAHELAGLLTSVSEAGQLPPLASEPTGNGKAYAKFLAIYNGLSDQGAAGEPADGVGDAEVDVVV